MQGRRTMGAVQERLEAAPAWSLVAVIALTTAAVAAWMLAGNSEGVLPLLLVLGIYVVAACRPAREVLAALAAVEASLVAVYLGHATNFKTTQFVVTTFAFWVVALIGWTAQTRRQRIDALEHEQEQAALRAAADERLRIAQELHDIVAHSLGVIAVQAGAGMHVIERDPVEARRAFENISRTSRSSLAEIRRLLGMVRSSDGSPAYAPAPGLADLDHLVEEVSGTGLAVAVRVDGDVERVPKAVGLTAFRIVQEALTNTIRHANALAAEVRVDCRPETVRIEVVDDGRGPTDDRVPGHGLIGMRERVAVYGGSLDAGPSSGGGYRIEALLPYDAEPAS